MMFKVWFMTNSGYKVSMTIISVDVEEAIRKAEGEAKRRNWKLEKLDCVHGGKGIPLEKRRELR